MPLSDKPRLSDLSASRQALVRLCQSTNYGYIEDLAVQDREPILDPAPVTVLDVKLDSKECPRYEFDSTDFLLRAEIVRLMTIFDRINNEKVSKLEVRASIPRRIVYEHPIAALGGSSSA